MKLRGVSSAIEDYLKAIYDLGEGEVKTQTLAGALKVSPASVSGMLKKLEAHAPFGEPLTLECKGSRVALSETLAAAIYAEAFTAPVLGDKGLDESADAD